MYPFVVTILFFTLGIFQIRKIFSVNAIITLILILVFFTGIFEQFNIRLFYVNVAIEGLMLILITNIFITASNRRRLLYLPGIKVFLPFSIVVLVSALINSSDLYQTYLYYRFFLTPFIFMLVIVNIELTERGLRQIVEFIQYLFIYQLIATFAKLIILGTPEHPVGTIIVAGGGVATYIPLIAAGFLLSRYYIYEKKRIYLILLFVFPTIAFASQKRGTFVFLPLLFLFIIYILGKIEIRTRSYTKKLRYAFPLLIISLIILVIGAKKVATMNPEGTKSGSFDLGFLLESSVEYNKMEDKYTYGRFASFEQVNEVMKDSPLKMRLFGFGPETLKGSTRGDGKFERFGVAGTYPGISYQFIQSGYLGAALWGLLMIYYGIMIFKVLKKEPDRYWRSIGSGSVVLIFLFLIDYLTYSVTFLTVYAFTLTIAGAFGLMMRRYVLLKSQMLISK